MKEKEARQIIDVLKNVNKRLDEITQEVKSLTVSLEHAVTSSVAAAKGESKSEAKVEEEHEKTKVEEKVEEAKAPEVAQPAPQAPEVPSDERPVNDPAKVIEHTKKLLQEREARARQREGLPACEICGERSKHIFECQACKQKVCRACYDAERKVCTVCYNR